MSSKSNTTYLAIRLGRVAASFRERCEIVELPRRQPGPGEILVRNVYCGVNGIFDTQIARNVVDYVKITLPTFAGAGQFRGETRRRRRGARHDFCRRRLRMASQGLLLTVRLIVSTALPEEPLYGFTPDAGPMPDGNKRIVR